MNTMFCENMFVKGLMYIMLCAICMIMSFVLGLNSSDCK